MCRACTRAHGRVCLCAQPSAGERNYHIFYHLLAGASAAERSEWGLLESHADYAYTHGEATSPGLVAGALWADTARRMHALGFGSEMQLKAFFRQVWPCAYRLRLADCSAADVSDGPDDPHRDHGPCVREASS